MYIRNKSEGLERKEVFLRQIGLQLNTVTTQETVMLPYSVAGTLPMVSSVNCEMKS